MKTSTVPKEGDRLIFWPMAVKPHVIVVRLTRCAAADEINRIQKQLAIWSDCNVIVLPLEVQMVYPTIIEPIAQHRTWIQRIRAFITGH